MTVAVLLVRAGIPDDAATTPTAATTTSVRPTTTTRTRPATTAATTSEQPRFYTVEAGDTFGSIATEFDTTVERLRELNPGVDSAQLTIGQRIRVE